ncbi:FeoB-associated Cys-rich membrane protein [Winogradskyella maritima]|uniref:FeoB-associated Cys-rich membrane protein n=1 Tax=Winogradskyella maritima TaxID=1517766 RepID=A0ABV8ADA6_9FLAO|nr:FeoB-associated Cys-rich membrane protein [Winogradskyella maritima]
MNELLQNILVFLAISASMVYLVRKFIWKPKKKSASGSCGTDDCGCH